MKKQPITLGQKQIESAGMKGQSGMATALLITIIALFVIFVVAGVYAVKNRLIWIAHGIAAAMNAVINKSGLPSPEKSQIKVEIDISDEFKKTVEDALGRSLS
jgi:hypothetical protein